MINYNQLREENDRFLNKYKIAKTFKLKNKTVEGLPISSFQITFADLINKYNKKNYKVSDLSLKNNLFQPSPLLMENNKIVDYYRFGNLCEIYDKDLNFLNKTTAQLFEKSEKEGIKKTNFKTRMAKTSSNFENDLKSNKISKAEYFTSIKTNLLHINRASQLLEGNNMKELFEEINSDTIKPKEIQLNRDIMNGKSVPKKPKRIRIKKPVFLPNVTVGNKKTNDIEATRNKEMTHNSILTTDNTFQKDYLLTTSTIDRKSNFMMRETDYVIIDREDEKHLTKDQIYDDINNKIDEKLKKIRNLETTYDRVINEREPSKTIFDYYEKEFGKEKKIIEDNFHK